ncbi:MAG: ATPase, YjeE family [Chitinophagaceae bacterium]|nr:ATPase, YjeE family [Chitinophagaceae bacterium]
MAEKIENTIELVSKQLDQLTETAKNIILFSGNQKILLFTGAMGVGKTTLIKEICKLLDVKENVTSPTYSIVNEYTNEKGEIFYHFDFYRIKNETEALDIGYEEYFFSGNYCFVEWPEKLGDLIPEEYVKVSIEETDNAQRIIRLSKHE